MEPFKIQALTYMWGIWNRRWLCLVVAWVVCVIGWTYVALMTDKYQVEAKVYIDTESLMGPLLRGLTVTSDVDQQIQVMLRTLISRPNLEQVIRATDPMATSYNAVQLESHVRQLNDNIAIKPLGGRNLYSIGFVDSNAQYAETVTQAMLSLLMESSFGDKRRDMEGAESFLDTKIAEYEAQLREGEQRVSEFKQKNADYLGAGVGGRLEAASGAATSARQELNLAETRRDSVKAQLAATDPNVAGDNSVVVVGGGNALSGDPRLALQQRIQQLTQTVSDLKARFTDDYPDVVSATKELAELKSELAAMPQSKPGSNDATRRMVANPVYAQLRLRLADEETAVALQQRRLEDATAEIAVAKASSQKVAEIQAQAADLDRNYGVLQKNYQELLARRESARLTKSQDERQQNVSFRVVEPPKRQDRPFSPNRGIFNTVVLFIGLGTGAGLGVLLTILAGTFSISDQLIEEFDLPIFGVISAIQHRDDARKFRMSAIRASASVFALVVLYGGVVWKITSSLHSRFGI